MPYKFPKRVVRGNDSLDVAQMQRDVGDVAEYLSAGLSEHNFTETTNGRAWAEDSALYEVELLDVNAPVGFGSGPTHTSPPTNSSNWHANAVIIPNSGVWETIRTLTFTSEGDEVLHIKGKQNYGWTGFNGSGHNHSHTDEWHRDASTDEPDETPKVIFALRVNGRIYNMAGQRNPNYRAYLPIKGTVEFAEFAGGFLALAIENTGEWPGVICLKTEVVASPGRALFNVGFNAVVFAPSGNTTVEVIARRVTKLKQHKFAANDDVAANTTTLSVVRYFAKPPRDRKVAGVTYTPPRIGDAISQANLFTNAMEPQETKANNLVAADLHKVNRYHTPSMLVRSSGVLQAGQMQGTVSAYTESWCPGETTNTFNASALTGTGWVYLGQSAGTELLATPASGDIPTGSELGKIILWGTVNVESIKLSGATFWENIENENHMALAGIYRKNADGTRNIIESSVVPISRRSTPKALTSYDKIASGTIAGESKPALHTTLDLSTTTLAQDVEGFGICFSVVNTSSSADVRMDLAQYSLSFEYYRK